MLFVMGMAASFPSGVVVASEGLFAAVVHGTALTVGSAVVALAQSGDRKPRNGDRLPEASPTANSWSPALAAATSVVVSSAIFPAGSVVMTVAAVVAADAFLSAGTGKDILHRLAGATVGALAGVVILILTFGATNDLAIYLAALAIVVVACEVLILRFPGLLGAGRQAAAAFVVVATSFPRPAATMDSALGRGLAVFGGVLLGALWVQAGRRWVFRQLEQTTDDHDGPSSICQVPDCDCADGGHRF